MFKSKKQQPEKSGLYNGGEMRTISTVEDGEYVTCFNYDKFAKVQTDRDKGIKYYSEISIFEEFKKAQDFMGVYIVVVSDFYQYLK